VARSRVRDEFAKWNRILESEGLPAQPKQIPPWHRMGDAYAHRSLRGAKGRISVRLPSDDPRNPSMPDRALITDSNRRCSEHINDRLSEWVWRECDWSKHPDVERRVMELHVIEGWLKRDLVKATGLNSKRVTRILTKHRALAGVPTL
jgi:hypothetical protein